MVKNRYDHPYYAEKQTKCMNESDRSTPIVAEKKHLLSLSSNHYDLIIIGGGAGGFSAATRASELGVKALMINAGLPIGGTCVNIGCVPSKILIEMSNRYFYTTAQSYTSLKQTCVCSKPIDFAEVVKEKDELVAALRQQNYIEVLQEMESVDFIEGYAKFVSSHEVEVDGRKFSADKFIIATGSRPRVLNIPGLDRIDYLTNREALSLEELPESLLVIGGGPIGIELAQMFGHFGTKVTILEKMNQILPRFDKDVSEELESHLEEEGITIKTNCTIKELFETNGQKTARIVFNGKEELISAQHILLAVGVSPNTSGLGLDKAGVKLDEKGFIETDPYFQTNQEHIFAVGDVGGKAFLETIAAKEGYLAVGNAFLEEKKTINYDAVPFAVFATPQVASVGLKEEIAKERFSDVDVRTIRMHNIPKAQALKETVGIVKMIIQRDTKRILGVHILAPLAADLIHEATLLVKYQMTIDDVIETIHVFPTMSEGIKRVAQAFSRNIEKMSCCVV